MLTLLSWNRYRNSEHVNWFERGNLPEVVAMGIMDVGFAVVIGFGVLAPAFGWV